MTAPSLVSFDLLLALCLFVFSVGASLLALNLYSLLRTGKMGASWRVLTIASVLFALAQALRLAKASGWPHSEIFELIGVIDLAFVLALAYAFYLQRQVFVSAPHETQQIKAARREEPKNGDEDEPLVLSAYDREI